jgi:hypothetical protein
MRRDNGTTATLLSVLALAGAAAVSSRSSRGSRDLRGIRIGPGISPDAPVSQPFKALFAAAKGSPALKKYQQAFRNAPFDLEVVITGEDPETYRGYGGGRTIKKWWPQLQRQAQALPEGSIMLVQAEPAHRRKSSMGWSGEGISQHIAYVQGTRKQDRPNAFALMTPFTLAHRLFDATITTQPVAPDISAAIQEDVLEGHGDGITWPGPLPWEWFREQAFNGYLGDLDETDWQDRARSLIAQQQGIAQQQVDESEMWDRSDELRDAATDELLDNRVERFTEAVNAVVNAVGRGRNDPSWEAVAWVESELEVDDPQEWTQRVLASLICPTAAGRRFLLTDITQAGADSFATWVLSYNPSKGRGRIPIMPLSPADARDFRAKRWVDRWAREHGGPRVTERKKAQYLAELQKLEPTLRAMFAHEDVGSRVRAWSHNIARRFPAGMKGAVEILKVYKVVSL